MTENLNTIRAIRNVNKLVREENDPKRLIERACAILTETLNYPYASITLLRDDKQSVWMTASSGLVDVTGVVAPFSAGTHSQDSASERAGLGLSSEHSDGKGFCRQFD